MGCCQSTAAGRNGKQFKPTSSSRRLHARRGNESGRGFTSIGESTSPSTRSSGATPNASREGYNIDAVEDVNWSDSSDSDGEDHSRSWSDQGNPVFTDGDGSSGPASICSTDPGASITASVRGNSNSSRHSRSPGNRSPQSPMKRRSPPVPMNPLQCDSVGSGRCLSADPQLVSETSVSHDSPPTCSDTCTGLFLSASMTNSQNAMTPIENPLGMSVSRAGYSVVSAAAVSSTTGSAGASTTVVPAGFGGSESALHNEPDIPLHLASRFYPRSRKSTAGKLYMAVKTTDCDVGLLPPMRRHGAKKREMSSGFIDLDNAQGLAWPDPELFYNGVVCSLNTLDQAPAGSEAMPFSIGRLEEPVKALKLQVAAGDWSGLKESADKLVQVASLVGNQKLASILIMISALAQDLRILRETPLRLMALIPESLGRHLLDEFLIEVQPEMGSLVLEAKDVVQDDPESRRQHHVALRNSYRRLLRDGPTHEGNIEEFLPLLEFLSNRLQNDLQYAIQVAIAASQTRQ